MSETTQHDPETGELPAIVPMTLLQRAVISGASVEVVEKLMELQERWEDRQARKAFDAAIAAAKAEIPTIRKGHMVDFRSAKGHTKYAYEDLSDIAEAIVPALSKYGLSYRYRSATLNASQITVTCIISHRDGYSEETTLPGSHDNSGNKNENQAVGSAATYLQRYTLKLALGLAAAADDDGQASGKPKEEAAATGKYSRALEYYEHWQGIIAIATDPADLGARWNEELPARRAIYWPPGQPDKLREEVFKRIEALKQKEPAT